MAQFPQIQIRHNIGNVVDIPNQLESNIFTYISTNLPIGVTAVPVDNAIGFSSGDIILLLSSIGTENAEFVTASAHTDQEFTIGTSKLPHNRGDLVQQVGYDQIVIYKSATVDGSYSELVTQNIQVTQQSTIVNDTTGLSTDYYKVQWKNSITNDTSDFSDPISVLSYPENSVASVINPVLIAMGIQENDPKVTTTFCLSAINDARSYVDKKLYAIRHAWREKFEFPIKLLAGNNFVDLPDDIDFNMTDQSVLAARLLWGNVMAPFNLRYIDKRSWNQLAWQVQGGYTQTDLAIGASTILLNSVGDFPAGTTSGVAYIATTDFDQTILQIAYTGINLVTNELTGVTGIDRAIPAGTRVWNTPTIAQPIYYSVWDKKLYFDRIIPDSLQGNNLYIDYYKKLDKVENLYQELPENYREIYKWYLKYAIKYRKDISLPSSDPDLKKFEDLVQALFDNLYSGQDTTIITS